jgi:hypothetical protein
MSTNKSGDWQFNAQIGAKRHMNAPEWGGRYLAWSDWFNLSN